MLTITSDDQATPTLRRWLTRLPLVRQQWVSDLARDTLALTIANNPVRSGRSRAAWIAAGNQLSTGPGTAIGQAGSGAASNGPGEGGVSRQDHGETTSVEVFNSVEYLPFVEYGTSRQPPVAMVRRALAAMRQQIAGRGQELVKALREPRG